MDISFDQNPQYSDDNETFRLIGPDKERRPMAPEEYDKLLEDMADDDFLPEVEASITALMKSCVIYEQNGCSRSARSLGAFSIEMRELYNRYIQLKKEHAKLRRKA